MEEGAGTISVKIGKDIRTNNRGNPRFYLCFGILFCGKFVAKHILIFCKYLQIFGDFGLFSPRFCGFRHEKTPISRGFCSFGAAEGI